MPKVKAPEITEEEFYKILQGLEIVHIDVDDFSGKVFSRSRMTTRDVKRNVSVTEKSEYQIDKDAEVLVWHSYQLTVSAQGEEKNEKLLTLGLKFRLLYHSKETFTAEFFEQFRQLSLKVQTLPFARAWIHDHCLRMGIPPLIMPLIRTQK